MPIPWIDYAFLSERLEHDEELVGEMLVIFLQEYERLLTELQVAAAIKMGYKQVAHGLKGMCRDVGATTLAGWAAQIENNEIDPMPHTELLKNALPEVTAEIEQWQAKHKQPA
jgi:HPt (histidine-containing phosphotransfer) domain-containing protein